MESERIELQRSLVNEISRGMGQLKQVKVSSSEQERVVERMVSSYEEALFILTGRAPEEQCESVVTSSSNTPPPSAGKGVRRKAQQRHRTNSVQGGYDDGYGWRKYAEKSIMNSMYPRSYYTCRSEACRATKKVRRLENDPANFDVTYKGVHTCRSENDPSNSMAISSSSSMGHTGQDQEYLKARRMNVNEMDDKLEFLDFSGMLEARSMAISASSNTGHVGQDREYHKTPHMGSNEMADNFELMDLIGKLDAKSMASSASSDMGHSGQDQ